LQLAQEQERRKQAEQKATENKAKYDAAIQLARAAMQQKKFAEARQQFQMAAQTLRTDEAVNGAKQADDELAKANAAALAAQPLRKSRSRRPRGFSA
jgi:uncharacterized protein HemY